jgi:quercetin dioxygenase-like cupin family protein
MDLEVWARRGFSALSVQFQETAIFESAEKTETTFFDRFAIPEKQRQLSVIKRQQLSPIHHTVVDGKRYNLGEVRNFAESSLLKEKFPMNFSCAWVKLDSAASLLPHVHEEDSMIILTEGEGLFAGQDEFPLRSGDIVYVPAGSSHGFKTQSSFWALSIQFSQTSLYEDNAAARVEFLSPFERLQLKNKRIAQNLLEENPIFHFSKEEIAKKNKKAKLLDCLQVMSNHFQQLMFLRLGLCQSQAYRPIFLEHLLEELGHDRELAEERKGEGVLWDPILHSSCSWFLAKNFFLDNPQRLIMVQMVLEKCASLFYGKFAELLIDENKSEHVLKHLEADEGHENLGLHLLRDEPAYRFEEFEKLLDESWSVMQLFLRRTADLVKAA